MDKLRTFKTFKEAYELENEPTHEIMALIALRKLSLQTRRRSNPMGLTSDFRSDPSSTLLHHSIYL